MLTTITGIVLLAAATVVGGARQCPSPCTCAGSDNALSITCQNLTGSDPDELLTHLERVLMSINNESSINVTSLTISKTDLRQIPPTICRLTSLTTLNLDNNRLTSLPDNCINKLKALKTLSAASNGVTYLQDGLFDGLNQLNSVNFDSNLISRIGLRVFSNVSDLLALRHIFLRNNRLTSIEPWPTIRGLMGGPTDRVYLSLKNNLISNFTNDIHFHFNCNIRLFANLDLSDNPIQHFTDLMRGWKIDSETQLLCLMNLKNNSLGVVLDITSRHVICDCVDFHFLKFMFISHNSGVLGRNYCKYPYVEMMAKIPLDQYVCDVTDRCPSNCRCIYQPSNATMHVDCSRAGLTSLPDELPPLPKSYVKYKLVFTGNKGLQRLEYRKYFVNTTILDLTDCGINEINGDAWTGLADIDRVLLDGNQLTSLSHGHVMSKKLSSASLSLRRNPWRCSCDDRWMTQWLKSVETQLNNPSDILCQSPHRLRGNSIMLVTSDDAFCTDPVTKAVAISISALCGVVLLSISFTLVAYGLRVQMHSKWKFHPFDRDECHGEDMLYDVFLCCSYNDHEQYGLEVLDLLESNNYRVCYHLRDFPGGELIQTSIVRAVQTSKRTICLMTTAFLDSAYCMHEFNVALHHSITLKRSGRLIVLMMLDNPSFLYQGDAEGDGVALRQYLRQYTYIDHKASDWTQKLLYALPVNGMREDADSSLLAHSDDQPLLSG